MDWQSFYDKLAISNEKMLAWASEVTEALQRQLDVLHGQFEAGLFAFTSNYDAILAEAQAAAQVHAEQSRIALELASLTGARFAEGIEWQADWLMAEMQAARLSRELLLEDYESPAARFLRSIQLGAAYGRAHSIVFTPSYSFAEDPFKLRFEYKSSSQLSADVGVKIHVQVSQTSNGLQWRHPDIKLGSKLPRAWIN